MFRFRPNCAVDDDERGPAVVLSLLVCYPLAMEIVVAAVICVVFVLVAWALLKVVQAVIRVVVLVVVAVVTLSLCLSVGRPHLEAASDWLRGVVGVDKLPQMGAPPEAKPADVKSGVKPGVNNDAASAAATRPQPR